jgi:hypothetical protein
LAQHPFTARNEATTRSRCRGVRYVLAWLEAQSGATWQERWTSSGAESLPKEDWLDLPRQWFTRTQGVVLRDSQLSPGLLMLVCGDVIRPTSAWLLSRTSQHLAWAMASVRDPDGFDLLSAQAASDKVPPAVLRIARHRISVVLARNGGSISDITVGGCVDVLEAQDVTHGGHQDQALLISLRRSDLQEWDERAGGRQPVLDERVVAQLAQFLDPDAGVTQDFDHGPGPERLMVLVGEVAPGGPGRGPSSRTRWMNGMPPHFAQLVAGHRVIDTSMGYLAVYPREVIEAHRAFIARRRSTRPGEEYRTPTDEEWDSFLGATSRSANSPSAPAAGPSPPLAFMSTPV